MSPFDNTTIARNENVGARKPVNYTNCVTFVIVTDRPK